MTQNKKNHLDMSMVFSIMRYFPLMLIVILFSLFILYFKDLSVENILHYTSSNNILSALILFLLFALKSLSMVMPLTIIYISTALIFPSFWAIIINFLGLIICMTIPYYIGRYSAQDFVNKILYKYPKASKLIRKKENSEFFLTFFIKMFGLIPNDVSSILLGSLPIPYKTFILGSVAGKFPSMIIITFLGITLTEPTSPAFIFSIFAALSMFILFILLYRKHTKHLPL